MSSYIEIGGGSGSGSSSDIPLAKKFGAVADGITDNSTHLSGVVASNLGVTFQPGVHYFAANTTLDYTCIFEPGAEFAAPDGVTVIIGRVEANPGQKIFSTTGIFTIKSTQDIFVEWWGAKVVASGTTFTSGYDSYPAFQAMFNSSASLVSSGYYGNVNGTHKMRSQPGVYRFTKPVVVTRPGTTFEGAGISSTYLQSDIGRFPIFCLMAAQGDLPTVAAPFGGPGRAWNAGFEQGYNDGIGYLSATRTANSLVPSMECLDIGAVYMESWTQMEISGFICLPTLPPNAASVFNISSKLGASSTGTNAIAISLLTNGKMHINFQTRNNTGSILDGDHPIGALQLNKWYYWSFSWNGTTSRFDIGLAGTDNPSNLATTAMTATQNGKLAIDRWSIVNFGAYQAQLPVAGTGGNDGFGYHYNIQIKSSATRTTTFVPPTTAETPVASTAYLTNFEPHGPNGEMYAGYTMGSTTKNTYSAVRQGNHSYYANYNGGMTLKDFTTNGGIYVNACLHGNYENIAVQGSGYAIVLNNSYSGKMTAVTGNGTMNGIIVNNGGLNSIYDCQANNTYCFGMYFKDAGVTVVNPLVLSLKIGIMIDNAGSQAEVAITSGAFSDEGVPDHLAFMYIDGSQCEVTIDGMNFLSYNNLFAGNYGSGMGATGYTLNYRGVYNPTASYAFNDTVRITANDPYIYRCLSSIAGVDPDIGDAHWDPKIVRECMYVVSAGVKVNARNCYFAASNNVGCFVRIGDAADSSTLVRVTDANTFGSGNLPPWTNRLDCFAGAPDGYEISSRGRSSGLTPVKNNTGVVTITGSNTYADVVFPVSELDAYYVNTSFATSVRYGTPAANSLNQAPYASNKTANGFRVNLSTAPGTSNAVDVGWAISRALPGPTPTITSIPVSHGSAAGGTNVTITGTNIQAGADATFAGVLGTTVSVSPPTSITVTTPAGTASSYPAIAIVNPDGPISKAKTGFTYDSPVVGGTPASISGAVLSLKADAGLIMSGSSVLSWSGYGGTLAPPDATTRPTLKTGGAGINGKPCVSTDGISQAMIGSLAITGDTSVFMIYRWTGYAGAALALYSKNSGGGALQSGGLIARPYYASGGDLFYNGVTQCNSTATTAGANVAMVLTAGAAGGLFRTNGSSGTSGNAFVGDITHICLGGDLQSVGPGQPFSVTGWEQMDIAEICVFNRILSGGDMTTLAAYALSEYAITL